MSDSAKLAFVDTNILVYAFEQSSDPRKEKAAGLLQGLMESNTLCLSTQVLQEFFTTVTRKAKVPLSPKQAIEILDDLSHWRLFIVDYDAIREAGVSSAAFHLSFWDSLILVSARRMGAGVVYSEDLTHKQLVGGVRILNPFGG